MGPLNIFTRQNEESDDASSDRLRRDILGSIFALATLFELISLASYLPLDSFGIFSGHLDRVHNLGGIVGALLAEWFLGTVGISGYCLVVLTLWLSLDAFRGIAVGSRAPRVVGVILFAVLGAVTCHLGLANKVPEASLLQGGMVGKVVGQFLENYFNTTGALILVSGAFLITAILTFGLSLTRAISRLFVDEESEDDSEFEEEEFENSELAVAGEAAPKAAPKRPAKKRPIQSLDRQADSDEEEEDDGKPKEILPTDKVELIPHPLAYSVPSTRLLKGEHGSAAKVSKGAIKDNSRKLTQHLLSFQITGEVVRVTQGPVLTTYEYKPSAGVKLSKIENLQDDLGVVLGTNQLRVIAPIPGKTVVGIEVPRPSIEVISLKEVLNEKGFSDKKLKIPIALGKNTDGDPIFGDLAAMPHLLVAGGTGSGKSVFMNNLIMSFLYRMSPQQLRMILVDPKMLEFRAFEGIPHLITKVITNNTVAINALIWAVFEMDRRYAKMADTGSKNIESYNAKQRGAHNKMPYIVVVVDELADLMMTGGELVEIAITRLAQKARAAGIHLVLATQRPSTDVVTGLIKANMPSRIAFKVPSAIDSRTVLDASGAEGLIGKGDALMIMPGVPLRRLHACYVSEDELDRVMKYVKGGKNHSKYYIEFSDESPDKKPEKRTKKAKAAAVVDEDAGGEE